MPECSPGSQTDPGEGEGSSGDTLQGLQLGQEAVGTGQKLHLASLVCPAVTIPDFLKPNYKCSVDNTQRGEEGRKIKPHQRNPIQTGCKNKTNLKTVTILQVDSFLFPYLI